MPLYNGAGINLNLGGQATNRFQLQAGAAQLIPPGWWSIQHGPYCAVQQLDPITTIWRAIGTDSARQAYVQSDGVNYRVANQSGCAIGALLTNGGSSYTSAPAVAFSAGGAKGISIVGGALSTTVTVTNAGTGYVYPPLVIIQAPPSPGIQATAHATLSGSTVSSVTVDNQGAGYTSPPIINLINDPRDTTGSGAIAVGTLTGAGTVTGVLVTDHGNAVTSIPTISFSGGGGSSAAATAIMNWSVTAYAVTGGGSVYSGTVQVTTQGTGIPTTATAYTNPDTQTGLLRVRPANITAALSSGAITATGQTVLDGGCIGGVASNIGVLVNATTPPATAAALTLTVGGTTDAFTMNKQ